MQLDSAATRASFSAPSCTTASLLYRLALICCAADIHVFDCPTDSTSRCECLPETTAQSTAATMTNLVQSSLPGLPPQAPLFGPRSWRGNYTNAHHLPLQAIKVSYSPSTYIEHERSFVRPHPARPDAYVFTDSLELGWMSLSQCSNNNLMTIIVLHEWHWMLRERL